MNQANDVFAEQYVEEYAKLRAQYPWWSLEQVMRQAKNVTVEYLYLAAKKELDIKPVWPEGFKP